MLCGLERTVIMVTPLRMRVPSKQRETLIWYAPPPHEFKILTIVGISSGLPYDTPVLFTNKSDYWGENVTLADELWDGLESSAAVVAIRKDLAAQHGLPESETLPWDDERSFYAIKAFHQTHCLVRPSSS